MTNKLREILESLYPVNSKSGEKRITQALQEILTEFEKMIPEKGKYHQCKYYPNVSCSECDSLNTLVSKKGFNQAIDEMHKRIKDA